MPSLGVFSTTPDVDLDLERLPRSVARRFKFVELREQEMPDRLASAASYRVHIRNIDELRDGYVKYLVTNIKRDDFIFALKKLFEGSEHEVRHGKTYPEPGTSGFLAATHTKNLSERQLANRAKHVCEGRCPPNCRQPGCRCNRGLGRCIG